jgi:putative transposase
MARLLRVQFPGAIYHVALRGNNRRVLFQDDDDRKRFLARLGEYGEEFGIKLYIFCLMTNHVHLVLETPQANLSQFMHKLETAYTVYFNLRHGESGHLLQDRFGAWPVAGDDYLLRLSRYVHLNPVHVGKLKNLELQERINELRKYRWSSYRGYIGKDKPLDYVEYGPMLGFMTGSTARKRQQYRKFVEAGLAESDEELAAVLKESRLSIGGTEFRDKIKEMHDNLLMGRKRKEDASLRRRVGRLTRDEILAEICRELKIERCEIAKRRRGNWARPLAAMMLSKYGGLTQRDIADEMGLSTGSAVSFQVRKLNASLASDKHLLDTASRIDKILSICRTKKA